MEESNDCMVQCQICGKSKEANFSACLRRGWDRCCGYVMRLLTKVDERKVRQAVKDSFLPEEQRSRIRSDVSYEARMARRAR